jgi:hypothetical protein
MFFFILGIIAIGAIARAEHRSPIRWALIAMGLSLLVALIPVELVRRLSWAMGLVLALILMLILNKPLRGQTWGPP